MNRTVERQIGPHVYIPTATELAAEDLCRSLGTELQPAEATDTLLTEWPHLIRHSRWGVTRGNALMKVEYLRLPPRTDDLEYRQMFSLTGDGDRLQPLEIREIMESAESRRGILLDSAAYPSSIERLDENIIVDIYDLSGSNLTIAQIEALQGNEYMTFRRERQALKMVYLRPAILHRPVPEREGMEFDMGYRLDTLRIIDLRVVSHQDHGLDQERVLPEHWLGQLVSSRSKELCIPMIRLEHGFPAEVEPRQVTNFMAVLLEDHITRLNAA